MPQEIIKVEINQKLSATENAIIYPQTTYDQVILDDDHQFISEVDKAQISKNKTDITTINGEIDIINDDITAIEQKNTNQDNRLDELEDLVGMDGSGTGTLTQRVAELEEFADTKNVAGGLASLGSDGKLNSSQVPDYLLGQVKYSGLADGNGADATMGLDEDTGIVATRRQLANAKQINEGQTSDTTYYVPKLGQYWIVKKAGTFTNAKRVETGSEPIYESISYQIGDWIIYNGKAKGYEKVDNTDAVSTVVGLTGNITKDNLRAALEINNVENTADINKNVNSAKKLTTARTINVSGDLVGTAASFDGTANVTITTTIGASKVTENKIADNSIGTSKLKNASVTNDKLGLECVEGDNIATNAIVSQHIGASQITAEKIANGAVGSSKLSDTGITPGTYSALTVGADGRATAGGFMIEIGTSGQTTPSTNLAVGGLFFKQI